MKDERPLPDWALELLADVARERGVTVEDVMGPRHLPRLVAVRREVVIRGRSRGLSLPDLACLLDRDHTTILHHVQVAGAASG